jgi:uncharacterized protein YbaA (DUF1428 family)
LEPDFSVRNLDIWTLLSLHKTVESIARSDAVNKRVMKRMDETMKKRKTPMAMPFNPKRMAYGGFKTVVEG